MAAITVIAAAAAIGFGAYQVIQSQEEKKKAQKAIDEFNETEVINPAEGASVSTRGEEEALESARSTNATIIDTLQRTGTRGVLGGIPRITEADIILNEKIGATIDRLEANLDVLLAEGEKEKQRIIQQNEQANLLGLGQQLQTARQDTISGVSNILGGALAIDSSRNPDKGGSRNQSGGVSAVGRAATGISLGPAANTELDLFGTDLFTADVMGSPSNLFDEEQIRRRLLFGDSSFFKSVNN